MWEQGQEVGHVWAELLSIGRGMLCLRGNQSVELQGMLVRRMRYALGKDLADHRNESGDDAMTSC